MNYSRLFIPLIFCAVAASGLEYENNATAETLETVTSSGSEHENNVTAEASEAGSVSDSEYVDIPAVGGPASVGMELKQDTFTKKSLISLDVFREAYDAINRAKGQFAKDYGFAFGFDYNALWLEASHCPGDKSASGGIFRAYGSWTLLDDDKGNTGSLVYKVENRHASDNNSAPSELGSQIGMAGSPAPLFSDIQWALTNLFWYQSFSLNNFHIKAGIIDATDDLNVFAMLNPYTSFINQMFVSEPAMPIPDQGLGATIGVMPGDTFYALAGFADANGDPTDQADAFKSFFDVHELFYFFEVGYTPSYEQRINNNAHLSFWAVDERQSAGTPAGWGVAFSCSWLSPDGRWLPFARLGYAKDGGALYDKDIGLGLGYTPKGRNDQFGIAANAGDPSAFHDPAAREQYTFESFYRLQLTQRTALTPDIQYILHPADNPEYNSVWIAGLRFRLVL